jgi:hypothetical protein
MLDAAGQRIVLGACVEGEHKPASPTEVWRVALYGDDLELRAVAMSCLETTSSFDASEVRRALPSLPDRLRYQAARCLIRAGDTTGIETLLEIADAPLASAADRLAAKELLSHLSGVPLHHGTKAWRQWYEDLQSAPTPTDLPAAPPF